MEYCIEYYRRLAAEITDVNMSNELRVLSAHIGKNNRITRRELTIAVFGKYTSGTDRKMRDIIPVLMHVYGVPIASTSGQAGYYICANEDERQEALRYLHTAGNQFFARANDLSAAKIPMRPTVIPIQQSIFGGF